MRKFGDQSGFPERRQGFPGQPEDSELSGAQSGAEDNFPFLEVGEYGEGGREAFIEGMGGVPVKREGAGASTAERESPGESSPEDENAGEEGLDLLSLYLEELKEVPPLTKAEEEELLLSAASGSTAARDRLIEGCLMDALRVIQDFMGGPLQVDEMIGTANLALVDAVQEYVGSLAAHAAPRETGAGAEGRESSPGALRTHVREAVRKRLREASEEERSARKGADSVADQANRLLEVSRVLAGELGRQPKVEELAQRMRTTPDEVRELLKMTMQAMDSGSGLE